MSSILNPDTVLFTTNISKRAIGIFTGYVALEEDSTDDLEITQHPVQRGANITDHAYIMPSTVTIRFIFTPGFVPLNQIYTNLLDLQATREPFSIVTGKRIYSNMLFKSINVSTNVTKENILSVTGRFQEVILVDVEETNVPVRAKQNIPEKTDSIENKGDKKAAVISENEIGPSAMDELFGIFRTS